MIKTFFSIFLSAALLTVCGCGGGSSPAATATGRFVDGPVGGLSYVSGSVSGTTAADGSFRYEIGKRVRFSVNGVVIGEAPAESLITPIQLAQANNPDVDASSPEVVNVVRFLMAISNIDGDGKMAIDPNKTHALSPSQHLPFFNTTSAFRSSVCNLLSNYAETTASMAVSHLSSSIYKECAGSYSGTYSGVDTAAVGDPTTGTSRNSGSAPAPLPTKVVGSWTISVAPNGSVSGETSLGDPITGRMENGTTFTATVNGLLWTGRLNLSTKTLSGVWVPFTRNMGGDRSYYTFTGSKL